MTDLSFLHNVSRPTQSRKRVGRGAGSGLGKTSGRGQKGAGARAGYKRRYGYEGGQFRTFMKMPIRGFSNVRFARRLKIVNINQIEAVYNDGEVVDGQSLYEKGFINSPNEKVKLLGNGTLTKKVTFKIDAISNGAKEKLRSHNA
ncbi:MAG: 50S ribosomal protein L15 [Parachlamydiales bacterium]|jgi:large subunit ribosomal protein L15